MSFERLGLILLNAMAPLKRRALFQSFKALKFLLLSLVLGKALKTSILCFG